MKKVGYIKSRSFAGEKNTSKGSVTENIKEEQRGRKKVQSPLDKLGL